MHAKLHKNDYIVIGVGVGALLLMLVGAILLLTLKKSSVDQEYTEQEYQDEHQVEQQDKQQYERQTEQQHEHQTEQQHEQQTERQDERQDEQSNVKASSESEHADNKNADLEYDKMENLFCNSAGFYGGFPDTTYDMAHKRCKNDASCTGFAIEPPTQAYMYLKKFDKTKCDKNPAWKQRGITSYFKKDPANAEYVS